jgi:hypothetical protein
MIKNKEKKLSRWAYALIIIFGIAILKAIISSE